MMGSGLAQRLPLEMLDDKVLLLQFRHVFRNVETRNGVLAH